MNTTNTPKTPSQTPAAVAARLRRALKKQAASPTLNALPQAELKAELDASGVPEVTAEDLPEGKPGVFAAMASSLSVEQAEAAEAQAIAAISASRASSKKAAAPTVKAPDDRRYILGAYKGRSGAMFDFMKRCGTLGEGFSREDAVASCLARAPHAAVSTRAQVLDYFAWAVRHGLLVVHTGPVVAPAPASKKAPRKSGKKASA